MVARLSDAVPGGRQAARRDSRRTAGTVGSGFAERALGMTAPATIYRCLICKQQLESYEAYEYRGSIGCAEHIEQVRNAVDHGRSLDIADVKRTGYIDRFGRQ